MLPSHPREEDNATYQTAINAEDYRPLFLMLPIKGCYCGQITNRAEELGNSFDSWNGTPRGNSSDSARGNYGARVVTENTGPRDHRNSRPALRVLGGCFSFPCFLFCSFFYERDDEVSLLYCAILFSSFLDTVCQPG